MGHKISSGISLYEAKMRLINNSREKLGVEPGMAKKEALNRFCDWRASKRACERCEEKDLSKFCPLHLICEEADRKESEEGGREIIIGEGCNGDFGIEEIGLGVHESKGLEVGQGL
jgi:hypothetical protein